MKFLMMTRSSSPSITCCPACCERQAGWQSLAGVRASTGVIGLLRLARLGLSFAGSSTPEQPLSQCVPRRRGKGCLAAIPDGTAVEPELCSSMPSRPRAADVNIDDSDLREDEPGDRGGKSYGVRWQRAKRLHSEIETLWRRGLAPDAATYEEALLAYAQVSVVAAQHRSSVRIVRVRTVETQGAAIRLLRQLCEHGAELTVAMYNAVILACVEEESWEWALYLLREMEERGLDPDQATFQNVIRACTRCNRWDWAVRMLSEMERRGLEPDLGIYHKVLTCLARMQQWKSIFQLFRHMEATGVPLTAFAYGIAVQACGQGGDWLRAVMLLSEGRERGCTPQFSSTYSAAMDACGSQSQWALAVELLAGMEREGLEPDQFVYAAVARACRAAEEEELAEVLEEQRVSARDREVEAATASPLSPKEEALAARWRPRSPPEVMARLDWGLL